MSAAEKAPTVFMPSPIRRAYWQAGQAAYAQGATQPEAIRAGLAAAATALLDPQTPTTDTEGASR